MHSTFMSLKYNLKAYWLGWKVRKLMSLSKFQSLKLQVVEIEQFYGPNASGMADNHVLKARENYVNALINTAYSKDWYKAVKSDLTADQKRANVLSKAKTLKTKKEAKHIVRQDSITASIKGINPDQRPVKPLAVNFDDLPVGVNKNCFNDDRPIKSSIQPNEQASGSGGMMMAFDFSSPSKPPPKVSKAAPSTLKAQAQAQAQPSSQNKGKKTFLKRGQGNLAKAKTAKFVQREVQEEEEFEVQKSPEVPLDLNGEEVKEDGEDSSPGKRKFLKRGQRQVYDPMKAVKEAKIKQQQEKEEKITKEKQVSLYEALKKRNKVNEDVSVSQVYDEEDTHPFILNQNSECIELSSADHNINQAIGNH